VFFVLVSKDNQRKLKKDRLNTENIRLLKLKIKEIILYKKKV